MKQNTESCDVHDSTNRTYDEIYQQLHRQRSGRRTVMKDTVECSETIPPINFLSLLCGSGKKADCAFINTASHLSNFCRYLWLEPESVFSKIDSLNDLPPKQLIASFHVSYVEI